MKFFFIMKISDIYKKFLEFPNISTDSRAIKKNSLFFAGIKQWKILHQLKLCLRAKPSVKFWFVGLFIRLFMRSFVLALRSKRQWG